MDTRHDPGQRLTFAGRTSVPTGLVLMLHGGAEHGHEEVGPRSLAWQRSRFMQRSIAPGLARHGLLTALLRFGIRGWNAGDGAEPSPLDDARRALATLRGCHPDLPIAILGHSMGARTAVHVAGDENVAGVIGLAPWHTPDDPVDTLAGRGLVCAHGSADKVTSPRATRAFIGRAEGVASSARYVDMGPVGHYMLRHVRRWDRVAHDGVLEVLGLTLAAD